MDERKRQSEKSGRAKHTDLISVRKNERSIRNLKRIVAALIVLLIGIAIYMTYPTWLPKLEDIFDKPISTITNDGEVASGNFPITPDEPSAVSIYGVKNNLLAADSHTLTFYDENGKERANYNHVFSKPVTRVNGKRVLVFDSGSDQFRLYNKSGEIYSKSTDNDILTASLGDNGTAAVLTASEKYASSLLIYDPDGKLIYRYDSVQRIMSASVDSGSNSATICTFSSEDGQIYSQVRSIEFDSDGEKMISEKLSCLAVACVKNNAGNYCVIGDTAMYTISSDGTILSQYDYGGTLEDYCADPSCSAVIISSSNKNTSRLIIADADAKDAESYREIPDIHGAKKIRVCEKRVVLLTSDTAYAYSFGASLAATAQLTKEYSDFAYINSALYLLSRHDIDKIGFEM